jgi:hypothetical protein
MQYFAGANTRNGFYSIFNERFENVDRLFILKGSSGCGKSTFMKRIAAKAKVFGLKTDLIFCSSDPDSLDGVVIPELSFAVADGTSPHLLDVRYPCVKETIINLGQFWDEKKLLSKRESIIYLTDKKSLHYKNAYKLLSAAGGLTDIKNELLSKTVNRKKAESSVLKFLSKHGGKTGVFKYETIFASAFRASGRKTIPVFENVKSLFRLSGKSSFVFLDMLDISAKELGYEVIVSKDPIDIKTTNLIYFPETETIITSLQSPVCGRCSVEKTLSAARFTDNVSLSAVKGKLKITEKLTDDILLEAQKELAEAKNVHNSIENIYIPAMDFRLMDEFTDKIIKSIFSE